MKHAHSSMIHLWKTPLPNLMKKKGPRLSRLFLTELRFDWDGQRKGLHRTLFWAAPPRSTRPGSSIGPPTITSKRAGHRPPVLAGGENSTLRVNYAAKANPPDSMQSDGVMRAWIRHAGQAVRRADRPLNFEVAAEPSGHGHLCTAGSHSLPFFSFRAP